MLFITKTYLLQVIYLFYFNGSEPFYFVTCLKCQVTGEMTWCHQSDITASDRGRPWLAYSVVFLSLYTHMTLNSETFLFMLTGFTETIHSFITALRQAAIQLPLIIKIMKILFHSVVIQKIMMKVWLSSSQSQSESGWSLSEQRWSFVCFTFFGPSGKTYLLGIFYYTYNTILKKLWCCCYMKFCFLAVRNISNTDILIRRQWLIQFLIMSLIREYLNL